ncbi:ABC transporter permease [Kangsaoukella pontilimi]|nr:ABC transporter permease [Kangsaoukella pontilimi]
MAIAKNLLQMIVMIGIFFVVMDMLGGRRMAVRGDFLLYVMSGIFVFMTHVKAMGAISGADGPVSPMMQHLPMTPLIAIVSAALGAIYVQVLSMAVLLTVYHLMWEPISIAHPVGAVMMLLLAWFSGCCFGLVFAALKPWLPGATGMIQMVYQRVQMFASGKMFLANGLPTKMFALFAWNPLFHIIDQGRGYIFENYNPMRTSLEYPLTISIVVGVIGILGLSYTNRFVSLSWSAGR